jgi:hypothetical protein
MKKILMVVFAATLIGASFTDAAAQQGVSIVSNRTILVAGNYTYSAIATAMASAKTTSTTPISYASTAFPIYSGTLTNTNTGDDSVLFKLSGAQNSVYTWCHVSQMTGANTGSVLKLFVTGDGSSTPVWGSAIYTKTLTGTTERVEYLINSGSGWPYTQSKWLLDGAGTQTTSLYSGLMVR